MPYNPRLIFDQAAVSVFVDLVQSTLTEAHRRGLALAATDREERLVMARRIYRQPKRESAILTD